MSRFTVILIVILAIPVILVGALFFLLSNPDYYRDQITKVVREQAGYELTIKGDISWRYFPPVALNVDQLDVRLPGAPEPLAALKSASIDLALWPLVMDGKVAVNGLSASGITVNAIVGKDGKDNWTVASAKPAEKPEADTGPADFDMDIRSVRVNDVALHYDDRQAGSIYDVTIPDLETGAIRFDEPTHLLAEVHIDDNAGMTSDVNAEGDITLGKGFGKVAFSGLKLRQTTELPDMSPINVQLTLDGTFDLNKSALDTSLAGTVNNSSLKGKLQADLADIVSANFNLALDKLNVNDYLGDDMAGEPAPASSADVGDGMKSAPPEDTQVLPLDLMRSFKLDGKLTVDSITYDSWQFSDFSAKIVNDTKKLSAILGMKGYDGEMAIDFTGSSEGSGAGLTRMNVNGIDLTKLLGFESVTGKITFDSNTTFTGNMLSDVLKTLDGTTTFAIDNGTLDVTPVKKLAAAVDALRGKQSSVANWPDKMPFDHLGGQHRFIKGVSADQQFNFSMELMEAKGTGGLDYFGNHLAYDIAVKLAENPTGQFQISKDLANIEWPIHCEGSLDDSPADLCRPDKSALEKMITGAAKEKLKEKVQEKVGDKLKDLFKGLR